MIIWGGNFSEMFRKFGKARKITFFWGVKCRLREKSAKPIGGFFFLADSENIGQNPYLTTFSAKLTAD